MFRKLKAGLGASKASKAMYRLDVAVAGVEGLPSGVTAARLQWARGAKVAVTKLAPASAGVRLGSHPPSTGHRGTRPSVAVLP